MSLRMSTLLTHLGDLLVNVGETQINQTERKRNIRSAVAQFGHDRPDKRVLKMPGNGGARYLLFGDVRTVDLAGRDNSLALTGNREMCAFKTTLPYPMQITSAGVALSMTGAASGDLVVDIYFASASGSPGGVVVSSQSVGITTRNAILRGIFREVVFRFDDSPELPAGDYFVVVRGGDGYAPDAGNYVSVGTISDGGDDAWEYSAGAWSVVSPAVTGAVRLYARVPGWQIDKSSVDTVEYPVDTVPPTFIDRDGFDVAILDGVYLVLHRAAPAANDALRVYYRSGYDWDTSNDPETNVPDEYADAIAHLAAHFACVGLATRYGQNLDSTISADSVDRKSAASEYRQLAKVHMDTYRQLLGIDESATRAGVQFARFDDGSPGNRRSGLFHR